MSKKSTTQWLDYDQLELAMQGQNTLEGFDVLVSYSESQLNNILQAATAADKSTTIIVPEFISTVASAWPSTTLTTYKCDLVLTNPNFSFDGPATSTEVILSFALTGTVTLQNPDKTWQGPTELPAGLLLAITSQLSAVTGSTHPESPGSRFIPATPPTSPSGDTGVNLATAGTTSALVIYIPKEEGTGGSVSILEGTVPVDPNTKAFLASLIKVNMENFFKNQDWYYYLAQVNNSAPENSGGKYELQPTSFGFSVSAGNGSLDSNAIIENAVCMWITVQGGSNRSVLAPGQSCTANFSVINTSTMPIPINNGKSKGGPSASIIFSHQLIQTLLFESALADNNCTGVASSDTANQVGMQMEFYFPGYAVHRDPVNYSDNHVVGAPGHTTTTTTTKKVDGFDFNLNEIKANMTLNPGLSVAGSPVGSITWNHSTIRMNWVYNVDVNGNDSGYEPDDHNGTADLDFSIKGQGSWVNNSKTGDDVLNFAWALPDTFDVKVTAEQKDISWWDSLWTNWSNGIPSDLQSFTFKLPTLSSVNSINYFLTTNLLLPGGHVFNPDPLVAASASDKKGISIPYDVLLTGTIAQNSVTSLAHSPDGSLSTTTKPRISTASRASRRDLLDEIRLGKGAKGANGTKRFRSPAAFDAAADKSLEDLVNTIVTSDPKGIMGSLVMAAASADPDDAAAKTWDILQKNGYGSLTADQIYSVLGTSTAEMTAAMTSKQALESFQLAAKKQPLNFQALGNLRDAPEFRLTIFGAVYEITDGPDYINELIVSTSDGTLTCDSETLYPTWTTDYSQVPNKTTVVWTTGKGSYTAVFKTSPNSDGKSYAWFEGNATPTGGTSQRFAGTQKQEAKDPIPDEPIQIADMAGVFFGAIGVVAFFAAIYWRKKDLAAAENGPLYKSALRMDRYIQERANKRARAMMDNHEIPWDDFQDGINQNTVDVLDRKLGELTLNQLQAMDNLQDPNWRALITEGTAVVSTSCTNDGLSSGIGVVSQSLVDYMRAGYVTTDAVRILSRNALQAEISEMVQKLTANSPGGNNSYIQAVAQERVLKRRAELKDGLVDAATKHASALGIAAGNTLSELKKQTDALADVQARISDKNTDPDMIEELEEQRQELDADVQQLQEDYTRESQAAREAQEHRDNVNLDRQADEFNAGAKEREAKRRLEEELTAE